MGHYLISSGQDIPGQTDITWLYDIIEAKSAKEAVAESFDRRDGAADEFKVWTLRTPEPRTYTVRVEERIIIE